MNRLISPSRLYLLAAVGGLLLLSSCVVLDIRPPQYEANDAEGNACRNQCVSQYYECIRLYAEFEHSTEICSKGMKSGLDLEHCYKQCVEHHGGTFAPYQEERRTPESTSGDRGDSCESDADCGRRLSCEDGRCE